MIYGSRALNDNGPIFGLNIQDLIGAVSILIVVSIVLQPLRLEFLAIPAAGFALFALIPIRLRHRRKIIRDSLGFWLGARWLRIEKGPFNAPRR